MAFDSRLQSQRFELKYHISEEVALLVRNFVSSYLEIDEYGATRPQLSYPVHSLYLDSDDLRMYWDTINGNKNRFKLRIRFYENRPRAPVYFEIKRRMNNIIFKQRAAVHRDAVEGILAGQLPDPAHLVSHDPRHLVALQRFSELMQATRAKPKVHVAYIREAWISPQNNAVRVTMDRDVVSDPEPTARLSSEMSEPVSVFGKEVILELKFTDRFPEWFRHLVAVFGLQRGSAAKYVDGVELLGEQRLGPVATMTPSARSLELEPGRSRRRAAVALRAGARRGPEAAS
jgi:hypothetical protein